MAGMASSRAGAPVTLAGRYRVIDRLGGGGMATVLLAEDEHLGRRVALKRLPASSPDEALARFRREARLGASLNHPNIVSIYDSAIDADCLLIVMEHVPGESLRDLLEEGPLGPDRTIAILRQVAAALDHAHASGVVHRDVKPSNMLISDDGTAKLADLGIATATDATSITRDDSVIGTLPYIAPERLQGGADSPAADVYALAAVAFEALSGQRAQRGSTPWEVVGAEPTDLREAWPAAPAAAAEVLRDGLAREPGRRPRSAGALIDALAAALAEPGGGEPRAAAHAPPGHAADSGSRRMVLAGVLAAIAGVAVAIAALGDGSEPGGQRASEANPSRAGSGANQARTASETVTTPAETAPASGQPTGSGADGAALNARGFSLIQQGRYEEAIPILQRAVDSFPAGTTDPTYAYALFNLGNALRLAGRPEEAIPILEQRLQIPNQLGVVRRELALARAQAGQASVPSGGVKPGKGPKPGKEPKSGKGHKGGEEDD